MTRHQVIIKTLRVNGGRIYAKGLVMSETKPGVWYEARVYVDWVPIGGARWVRITGHCTCPAGLHSRPCKHIIWLANKAIARTRKELEKAPRSG